MQRKLIAILGAIILSMHIAMARDAADVLRDASRALREAPSISTPYTVVSSIGQNDGVITVSGNKFKAVGNDVAIWFDGKTLWSLDQTQKVVYVSEPSEAELAGINPLTIIGNVSDNYNLTQAKAKKAHEQRIVLNAKKSDLAFKAIELVFTGESPLPVNVTATVPDGSVLTFYLKKYTRGEKLPASHFRYDSASYPGIEVVDMR